MSSYRQMLVTLGAVALALVALSGCQVRPLYADGAGAQRAIAISEPRHRVEQLVRNELVFIFGGGAGEPTNPVYRMKLLVTSRLQGVLPSGGDDEFTAARVVVDAKYTLTSVATDEVVLTGERSAVAQLDNPAQHYGTTRAIHDAENRAAREAAQFVNADIAGKLAALGR